MRLLLFAQEEPGPQQAVDFAAPWFEFASKWGDSASIIGLLITLIGFPTLWWMQRKIKIESRKALNKVAMAFLYDALQQISWHITMTQESARVPMWQRAFDSCSSARETIIRIQQNPHLTQSEKGRVLSEADNLRQVKEYIERNKLGPDPSAAFQQVKKDALETAREFITGVQARLDAIRWEI